MGGFPKLTILSEQLRGKTFELNKDMHTVGRIEERDICIMDPTISTYHCSLIKSGNTYILKDNNSTNGTRVNNVPITEQELQNSDIIQLGNRSVNARAYVARFNFTGADQEKKVGVLSGGERNRLHLAMALKEGGNVLLLDEPTNDIDVNTLRALEEGLENFAGCAVVISHDRWFLDRIATHILSFEGDSQVVFFEGSYSEYEEHKRQMGEDTTPKRVKYRKLLA